MVVARHPEVKDFAVMMYVPVIDGRVIAITQEVTDAHSIIHSRLHGLHFVDNKCSCMVMNIKAHLMLYYNTKLLPDNYFFNTFINETGHIRKIIIQDTMILFGRYAAIVKDPTDMRGHSWITVQKYVSGVTSALSKVLKAVNVAGLN
jgi:hypothetical protein